LTLKDCHRIFQNVIAARQKDIEFDSDYNSFSFELFSSIISDQFFRKSTFDSINDIDFFDLEVRSSSLFKSFNRSFDKHVSLKQLVLFVNSSRIQSFRINRLAAMKENIKMISLFEITRLKDIFEYQTWQIEMRDQLIFMNLWHYVEIEENLSVFIVSSTSKKVRKFRVDNLKTVAIIRNRLKCNNRDLLKNEINVIKTWQILKKLFNSCESKILMICLSNCESSF
jgi:hypothetical protein